MPDSIPFGLWTPRQAIAELVDMAKKQRGREWYVKRMAAIERHLQRSYWHGQTMLDMPMSMSAVDTVLKEAWHAVKSTDEMQELTRALDAKGMLN